VPFTLTLMRMGVEPAAAVMVPLFSIFVKLEVMAIPFPPAPVTLIAPPISIEPFNVC